MVAGPCSFGKLSKKGGPRYRLLDDYLPNDFTVICEKQADWDLTGTVTI